MSSCERFINLTGVLNPQLISKDIERQEIKANGKRAALLRNCIDDRETLLAEEKGCWFFWKLGGERMGRRIVSAINQRLASYEVPSLEFKKEGVHLTSAFAEVDDVSGEIFFGPPEDLVKFAGKYTHERLHTAEARIFKVTEDGKLRRYRQGLCSHPKPEFNFLHEGTIEKTTREILKSIKVPVRRSVYDEEVHIIELMCRKMNPKEPEAAFRLFEQASYGRGELLPLARAIEKTWRQKGGFSEFRRIAKRCAEKRGPYRGKYKVLREFISTKKPRQRKTSS